LIYSQMVDMLDGFLYPRVHNMRGLGGCWIAGFLWLRTWRCAIFFKQLV